MPEVPTGKGRKAVSGAISYDGTRGAYGTSNGIVMVDKILFIDERRGHSMIHLSDGSAVASSTPISELRRRINEVLHPSEATTISVPPLPEAPAGEGR